MESEIFGHKAGAFTRALKDKKGLFEEANHGTIFLDEIGGDGVRLAGQTLARARNRGIYKGGGYETHENRRAYRVGHQPQPERRDSEQQFPGRFVFPLVRFHLHLPPLRERREDIPELAAAFLKFFAAKMGKQVKGICGGLSSLDAVVCLAGKRT